MITRKLKKRVIRKVQRGASLLSKRLDWELGKEDVITNIFDYNNIIKDRPYPFRNRHFGNVHYGMEYSLRKYSGYKKTIWCASEHTFWTEETDNLIETKEHEFPVVLVPSEERRDKVKKLTDKIIIPIGPRYAPYADTCLDAFHMSILKKSLGKVIVAYPQHNNIDSYFENQEENFNEFLSYLKDLKEKYDYDTVLVCMYFLEIETGGFRKCLNYGFDVVTCGRYTNYDFGVISNTLFELADLIVSQSYSTMIMGGYFNKPMVFMPGVDVLCQDKNQEKIVTFGGFTSFENTFDEVKEMFNGYNDNLTEQQKVWCSAKGGYNCVKSKKELCAIFDLASELHRKKLSKKNLKTINSILEKEKYKCIKEYVLEGI